MERINENDGTHVALALIQRVIQRFANWLCSINSISAVIPTSASIPTLINHIQKEESKALNDFDDAFDYADLIEASKKENATIIEAIQSGYTIKYVSKFGIKKLLDLKFSLQEGTDYQMEEAKFFHIPLNEEQLKTVETMLAPHWLFKNKRHAESCFQVDLIHVTELE